MLMLIVAFYLVLQPGSEDNCSRCAQLGSAKVGHWHANLHCHGLAVMAVTAEGEFDQCPIGLDGKGTKNSESQFFLFGGLWLVPR